MLRVAVIGAGRVGSIRTREVARSADARLVAVVDTDEARAQELANAYGCAASDDWEQSVTHAGIDAVVVATPHNWLAPITLAALRAHKHVLCEKPLASTSQEAERLVQCASENGTKLKTGFNHRHHPAIKAAHGLASGGQIGRLLCIRCRYGHGGRAGYEREWRTDPGQSGGGELLDQGVHALDLFRWFLGDFSEMQAMLGHFFWPTAVEDNVFCTLRTPRGQVASLHASWTQWKNLFSFEVFGDEGYVGVEGLGGSYGRERLVIGHRAPNFGTPREEVVEFEQDSSWADEWKEFVSAIREDRAPLGDGRDGWEALRLVQAAYESAEHGQRVRLQAHA